MMLDLELLAHVSYFLIWKLGTIIRDDRFLEFQSDRLCAS